jgi:GNAT superfamily N-acetyltransferase
VEVRQAGPDDADEVIRLAQVMFDELGLSDGATATNSSWREHADARFRAGLDEGTVAAFVIDAPDAPGRLVASAAASISQRLPTPMGGGRNAYVQWVATEPEWRRQGLARHVMVELVEWARAQGVGMVDLHASADGAPLYAELGFRPGPNPELRLRIES